MLIVRESNLSITLYAYVQFLCIIFDRLSLSKRGRMLGNGFLTPCFDE